MNTNTHDAPPRPARLYEALAALEELERYRQLPRGVMPILFFASAAFSVRAMFWMIDLFNWMGLDAADPVLPSALGYLSVFVTFIVCFLALRSILDAFRFRDVRGLAGFRLKRLELGPDALSALRAAVAARSLRHGRIFDAVIAGLAENHAAEAS